MPWKGGNMMAGNTTGEVFRITTWGESHGWGIGVVIDGCPPLLTLSAKDIQAELDRRRPGQSDLTTPRKEQDEAQILSGIYQEKTTGAPISIVVRNTDAKPEEYASFAAAYRPSHADFTYERKYGIRDPRGGGRASARITIGRVAAGAVARKILTQAGIEIVACVESVHGVRAAIDPLSLARGEVEASAVRCPDRSASALMEQAIRAAKEDGDSLGGTVLCVARNVPAGLGEPEFDKIEADLAKACMSIPATKGIEIGSGFAGAAMRGSEHNDAFEREGERIVTSTNHSGGVQGGITNGMPIVLRVAFKPTSTIAKSQKTVDAKGNETRLAAQGRHDPCVLPRAVPIVEASVALVLCDHYLRQRALRGSLQ
jgi:chorismate synthase